MLGLGEGVTREGGRVAGTWCLVSASQAREGVLPDKLWRIACPKSNVSRVMKQIVLAC